MPRDRTSANTPWSDEELRSSVDVYVLLLRMQVQGIDPKLEPLAQALLEGPLALRNDAAIRYRMRNISAVLHELGGPILDVFSPAESIGRHVRPRILALLLDNPELSQIRKPAIGSPDRERRAALAALALLRERVEGIEHELSWMGHNNPPPGQQDLEREDFRQALASIDALSSQLAMTAPDISIVEHETSKLVRFGNTLGKWVAGRVTKFVDAAAVTAAPLLVAKVTGVMPALVDALEAIGRAVVN